MAFLMASNVLTKLKGARAMVESREDESGKRIVISFPMLTVLLTLGLYVTGHLTYSIWWSATMTANVNNMANKVMEVQTKADTETRELKTRVELQDVYIQNLREQFATLKGESKRR